MRLEKAKESKGREGEKQNSKSTSIWTRNRYMNMCVCRRDRVSVSAVSGCVWGLLLGCLGFFPLPVTSDKSFMLPKRFSSFFFPFPRRLVWGDWRIDGWEEGWMMGGWVDGWMDGC